MRRNHEAPGTWPFRWVDGPLSRRHGLMTTDSRLFADVEIRLQALQPAGYPVEIRVLGGEEYPRGYLDPVALDRLRDCPAEARGPALMDLLLADAELETSWAALRAAYPHMRLALRIDEEAVELQAVPWEELSERLPSGQRRPLAVAPATPFGRYEAGAWSAGPPEEAPLRVLSVVVNAANAADFGLAPVDGAATGAALAALQTHVPLEVRHAEGPMSPTVLVDLLAEHPHSQLLYLTAHTLTMAGGGTVIALADERNRLQLVDQETIADLLAPYLGGATALRVIVLASCHSAGVGTGGLSRRLARAGASAVVGFRQAIDQGTALQVGRTFLERLARHGYVDRAANDARAALLAAGASLSALPVLYSRLRSGRLLVRR